jgi:hypothetical protein
MWGAAAPDAVGVWEVLTVVSSVQFHGLALVLRRDPPCAAGRRELPG